MNGRNVRTGVCIFAENMDRMVRFYRDILGFETDWDGGAFAEFFTASGKLSFFMYSKEEFIKAINEDYKRVDGINQTFGIRNFCVSDPEGNLLEIGSDNLG